MLSAVSDAEVADWVAAGMRDFDGTVGSVVPAVFDAYARVFHPASRGAGVGEAEVRWAEVAAANTRVMHPAAEWGSLTGSWQSREQPGLWEQPPRTGELPRAPAVRLAAVLARYTKNPECSYFALCNGWDALGLLLYFRGGTPEDVQRLRRQAVEEEITAWRDLVQGGAAFTLPNREMRLLRGPLAAIEEFYEFHHNPPNLWWPEDHAWCVGTDIDLMSTYVGGSSASITAVLADERLESFSASVDQGITWEADTVNPMPTQRR